MTGCQPLAGLLDAIGKDLQSTPDTQTPAIKGLATGIEELDCLATGLRAGSLTIIGGRPAMGCTWLALSIARKIALEQGKSVAIFSLDFDGEQAARRILLGTSELDRPRDHRMVEAKNEPSDATLERLRNAPIFIDATASNLAEIRASIQVLIGSGVLPDLVVIDDLQMLASTHSVKRTRTVVRNIKSLAQEIAVPVMVTTKLSRRIEKRRNKRPALIDLPEGVITGGADLVMTIFREEVYSPETPRKGVAEICVMRNRFGRVGMLELCFRRGE